MHVDAHSGSKARQPEATPEQRAYQKLFRVFFEDKSFVVLHALDVPNARLLAYRAVAENGYINTGRITYVETLPQGSREAPIKGRV